MRGIRLVLIPTLVILLLLLSPLILTVPVEAYMLKFTLNDLAQGSRYYRHRAG